MMPTTVEPGQILIFRNIVVIYTHEKDNLYVLKPVNRLKFGSRAHEMFLNLRSRNQIEYWTRFPTQSSIILVSKQDSGLQLPKKRLQRWYEQLILGARVFHPDLEPFVEYDS